MENKSLTLAMTTAWSSKHISEWREVRKSRGCISNGTLNGGYGGCTTYKN